jgi:hypothetical protein
LPSRINVRLREHAQDKSHKRALLRRRKNKVYTVNTMHASCSNTPRTAA